MQLFNLLSLDFAAKVRWRMKYQQNPLFVTLQDKYKVREYAKSKGVKSPELLFVTDRPEDIPFAELPNRYMIKANHGCGWNILCYDSHFYMFGLGIELINEDGTFLNKDISAKDEMSEAEVIKTCKEWLARKHKKAEWAYQHIPPKIIIEKLLDAGKNRRLFEYKVLVFHGVPKAIFACSLLYRRRGERGIYYPNFEEVPLTKRDLPRPDSPPQKPDRLPEILEAASRLGEDVDFARVDLYDTNEGIVLGEMTLYSSNGKPFTPTFCPVFNKWLGDQWVISKADTRKAILLNLGFKTIIRKVRYKLKYRASC